MVIRGKKSNKSWNNNGTKNKFRGSQVLMGNNMTCHVIGIDIVTVKIHDGVVRTFGNVRHVLDLQRNLVSLGSLDEIGHTCKVEGGVMRVSKGALSVMKGVKRNGLYILSGHTVVEKCSLYCF